jgi:signal transduction histidine kinase
MTPRGDSPRRLVELACSVSSALDLDAVLAEVIAAVAALRPTAGCAIRLVDPAAGGYRLVAVGGTPGYRLPEVVPFGQGLVHAVAAGRQPLLVRDAGSDPRVPEHSRAALQALPVFYGVPIEAGGDLLGILVVLWPAAAPPDDGEQEALALFAGLAAVAIQHARLFAESEARREEALRERRAAEVYAEVARSLSTSLDLATVLQRVVEGARELTGADLAHIALLDQESGTMVFRNWAGDRRAGMQAFAVEPGKGVGGQVLLTGRPFRTADYARDPRIGQVYAPTVVAEGIVASMAVPVIIDGGIEALLFVDNRRPRPFTDGDEAALVKLADHAGIAIRNARVLASEQAERGLLDAVLREREQLLARAEAARAEAEAANRAKDEFLAVLGHELRNPLAAIASAAAGLGHPRLPPDRVAGLRSILERQTRHLGRLVDDLLDVGRLTSGKVTLRRAPVDLSEIAERGLASLAEAGRTGGHRVELRGEPVVVEGDATRLQQVVWNLLDNALKYTPPGGRITVSVGPEGEEAVLRVRDTGRGIPTDVLPHIFDLFVQGANPGDPVPEGLGLGLTLARRLVELHGGAVGAHSGGPGQGSEFVVRLPRPAGPPVASPHASSEPAATPTRRILLVEDNADVRDGLRLLLEAWGHEVAEVQDGLAAVARARTFGPEVGLIDIGLPGLDGYAVARQLREQPGGAGLFLVALTGYGQPADRRRAMEAGFDAHMVKPVDVDTLARVLAQAGRR